MTEGLDDPQRADKPSEPWFPKAAEIRLAMGEMTAAEMRVAVAAIRWVLSTRSAGGEFAELARQLDHVAFNIANGGHIGGTESGIITKAVRALEGRAQSARTSITPEWREQWDIFVKDYNRYVDGDPKMPFSLLRESLAAFVTETDLMQAGIGQAKCEREGHVWVGIGDEGRSVCDDCGIDKATNNPADRKANP